MSGDRRSTDAKDRAEGMAGVPVIDIPRPAEAPNVGERGQAVLDGIKAKSDETRDLLRSLTPEEWAAREPLSREAVDASLLRARADHLEASSWPGKNAGATKYEADQMRKRADEIEGQRSAEATAKRTCAVCDAEIVRPNRICAACEKTGLHGKNHPQDLAAMKARARNWWRREIAGYGGPVISDETRDDLVRMVVKAFTDGEATERERRRERAPTPAHEDPTSDLVRKAFLYGFDAACKAHGKSYDCATAEDAWQSEWARKCK